MSAETRTGIGRGRHGNQLKGAAHPQWKGGRQITIHGYVRVLLPQDHPLAGVDRRAYEHHVVLFDRGVELRPDETVHHINGDKTDNRFENLQVLTRSEHARIRREDRCPACGRYLHG